MMRAVRFYRVSVIEIVVVSITEVKPFVLCISRIISGNKV